ncbi:MAG: hypothetical protein D6796_10425, partial [Caldilineae bacterium]
IKPLPDKSEKVRVPLRIPIRRLRWALQDGISDDPLPKLLNGQLIVRPLEVLLQAESPVLIVELPGVDVAKVDMTLLLLNMEQKVLQEQTLTTPGRGRNRWRFELARFADTLRHNSSPLLRFDLRLQGLPDAPGETQIPLMRLTQSLMVENITVTPIIQGEQVQVKINWTSARPLQNRFVRFWPLWQPWQAPIYRPIPDDARGEFIVPVDPAQPPLQPIKYRLELGISDPWSPPVRPRRPTFGTQNTLDVALVPPEHRLQILEQESKTHGKTFARTLEYAIIQQELNHQSAYQDALQWCYQHLDRATIPQMLTLVECIKKTGGAYAGRTLKALRLKLFAVQRIKKLLRAYQQEKISHRQFQAYLANMPDAKLLPVKTAILLLDVPDVQIDLPVIQRLIQH